jgi:hypothetical protein
LKPSPIQSSIRRAVGQQFVQQDSQGIDVGAGVDVEAGPLGLLGAHVQRRADHLGVCGEEGLLRQLLVAGLGHAEVNHLGLRPGFHHGDQHVGGFDVAMNDSLLMSVLDGSANFNEQAEPLLCGELGLITVFGDGNAVGCHKWIT